MARYIDADALISSIKNELWDWDTLDDIKATSVLLQTVTDIQNMPTADVAEVVRCKDCKWFDRTQPYGTLSPNAFHCNANERFFRDDFYCGYGERRK